jgi:hypothetical protein
MSLRGESATDAGSSVASESAGAFFGPGSRLEGAAASPSTIASLSNFNSEIKLSEASNFPAVATSP